MLFAQVFRESCLDLSEGDIVEVIAGPRTAVFNVAYCCVLVWNCVERRGACIYSNKLLEYKADFPYAGGGGWFYGRIISTSGTMAYRMAMS